MTPVSSEVIEILSYLLPGFISAAILYSLTPAPRPAPFERVVQALIFTVIIQVIVTVLQYTFMTVGRSFPLTAPWTESARLIWSVVVSIVLGIGLARASNYDSLHRILRGLRITHLTSFSSEWYGALAQNYGYVVLHLSGERRLYGWPDEWPNTPDSGHFVVSRVEWLEDDKRIPLLDVNKVLIAVSDVEMIEFMGRRNLDDREDENG